jgi:uncharacterized protein
VSVQVGGDCEPRVPLSGTLPHERVTADEIGSLETALRREGGRRARTLWLPAPGARLHAWLVSPSTRPPWPLVVMAHGWAAVKEMNLDYFAAAMVDAGIAALLFDHRGFGGSDGLRGDIDPHQQIADYRYALTYAGTLDGVDPARLGVWGTSYSGGHVLCVAAQDARVRAAVAQVPTISGSESMRRRVGEDGLRQLRASWDRDQAAAAAGHPPRMVPAAEVGAWDLGDDAADPGEPVAPHLLPPAPRGVYPDAERGRYYAELPEPRRRTWRNRITALSVERYSRYEPGLSLPQVTAPLLVIRAEEDTITPSDLIARAVEAGGDNVRSLSVPGGHYGVYTAHRARVAREAARFLATHLT